MITNLASAINKLESLFKSSPRNDLSYLKEAYKLLDINLDNIKKIHVAGTNGKGSTSLFLTNILINNNLKVGTFISPYLLTFNERIQINGNYINDDDLLSLINYIFKINDLFNMQNDFTLSFFELVTLMAFKYFYDKKVDVIIIEVGIGGLLDVTNILNYDLSLITNIGYDHMKQLGNSLENILFNKLGIVKKGNHLITTINNKYYLKINDYIKKIGATYQFIETDEISITNHNPLTFKYENEIYELPLLGYYQTHNATLAIKAAKYLYNDISYHIIKNGLILTKHGARLEEVLPNIYLDGAHNIDAVKALVNSIKTLFKNEKIYLLFSALADKNIDEMLIDLKEISKEIIITSFIDPRFKDIFTKEYQTIKDPKEALNYLISKKEDDDIILITGSIHFVGYMKKNIIPKVGIKK